MPYSVNALEPFIDHETITIHHNKHLKTYVDNLNNALEHYPCYHHWTLERLICNNQSLPREIQTKVKNNAGGVYNHNLYFNIMSEHHDQTPRGELLCAIQRSFGSLDGFQAEFKKSALEQFGSGWTWLVVNCRGKLGIVNTANQDTVLPLGLCPILLIDLWEHAYYLQYQNRRAEYIDNWFHVINWESATENAERCIRHCYC